MQLLFITQRAEFSENFSYTFSKERNDIIESTRLANIPNLPKRLPIHMYFCVSPLACLSSCCCSLISPYSNIKPVTLI